MWTTALPYIGAGLIPSTIPDTTTLIPTVSSASPSLRASGLTWEMPSSISGGPDSKPTMLEKTYGKRDGTLTEKLSFVNISRVNNPYIKGIGLELKIGEMYYRVSVDNEDQIDEAVEKMLRATLKAIVSQTVEATANFKKGLK